MNADGSNIRQLTNGEGNPQFDINGPTPWSPDGTKLIFVNKLPEEQDWKLYALDIDGRHTTTLTSEPGEYLLPSWSPDGEHIAFIYYESDARPLARHLFVVDRDGNHLTELTESLRIDQTSTFLDFNYYWSPDGASIFFTASSTVSQETTLTVYEASLDGSLTAKTKSAKFIINWWNGTTLQQEGNVRTLTWLRADGSQSTLDICEGNTQISSDQIVGITYKQSDHGSLVVGSNCSTSDGWMFYWANADGTLTNNLLDSPIGGDKDNIFNMTWSPDDHFIAFVVTDFDPSNGNGALYILDVEQARNDPSVEPLKMEESSSPSWQPRP
jgi:Tol biopolymer transport system component